MGSDNIINGLTTFVKENPIISAVGAVGVVAGAGLGTAAIVGAVKRRKSKGSKTRNTRKRGRRIKHTKRGWKQDRKRRSKQKWEVAYQKRKKKHKKSSSKRRGKVYYAKKTGQPYILLSNGKAKFIKGKRRKK